jgi:hypothetical protein
MQYFKFSVLLLFCLLAFAQNAQAQATLSVQGSLQNFNGTAVDNGQYDITFRLYTTDAGGTAIWTEVQSVSLIGGVYSVLLGAVTPLNVPFDQTYYLGLTIPGGPEHTPRARMTASPYALSVIGEDNKFPSTGNVGIGTTTPSTTLDVDGSVATEERITVAPTVAVDAKDHVIFLDHTANQNITLPAASASEGRHLMLVNKAAVAKTLTASNYLDLAGATSTTIPATGVVELQSDGSVWRQTGGYVKPGVIEKAYVRASVYINGAPSANITPSTDYTPNYTTEHADIGNNFSNSTFTAPRTGLYSVTGQMYGISLNNSNGYGGTCSTSVNCVGCGGLITIGFGNTPGVGGGNSVNTNGNTFAGTLYMEAGQTFTMRWNQYFIPRCDVFSSSLMIAEL